MRFLKRIVTHRIFGRKTNPVQERVTGNPIEMHEYWLRTARGRPVLRPSATARMRTAGYGCPAGGTASAKPCWSCRTCCVRGRFTWSTGLATRDDQTRL